MEKKVIVFDFDKTLINDDSTLLLFNYCCKKSPLRYSLMPIYFLLKVLSKLNFISVKREKEFGLLFFCPQNIADFRTICYEVSQLLKLNNLYNEEFLPYFKTNSKLVIASAGFTYCLENLFPDILIIGTTVNVNCMGKIVGIKDHPFREEKARIILSEGIEQIYKFFTDSKNDIPTSILAKKTNWVKNGEIVKQT